MTSAVEIHAADSFLSSYRVSVKQVVEGDYVPPEGFSTYVLTPVEDAPLPEDCIDMDILELYGNDFGYFGIIRFEKPGVYKYRVTREPNSLPGYKSELRTYELTIAALNDGSIKMVVHGDSEKGKLDEIIYHDRFKEPSSPVSESPETGDHTGLTYFIICACSAVAIGVVRYLRRRMDT